MKKRWKGLLALCMVVVMLADMAGVAGVVQAAGAYTVTVLNGNVTKEITLTEENCQTVYTLSNENSEKWLLYYDYDEYDGQPRLGCLHVHDLQEVWDELKYYSDINRNPRNIQVVNEEGTVLLMERELLDSLGQNDVAYRSTGALRKNLTFSGDGDDATADLPTIPHYNLAGWKTWYVSCGSVYDGSFYTGSLTGNKITRGQYSNLLSTSETGAILTATRNPISYSVPVKKYDGTAGTSLTFTVEDYADAANKLPVKTKDAYKWQFIYNSVTKVTDVTGIADIWKVIDALVQGGGTYDSSLALLQEVCTHAHTEVRDTAAANCTAGGYTGDTYCADCNEKISTGSKTDALGHSYTAAVTKEATYTETGVKTYTCSRCGDSYTESIPKLSEKPSTKVNNKKKNSAKLNSEASVARIGKKMFVTWGRVEEADGYDIFAAQCGKEVNAESLTATVKGEKKSVNLTKIAGKTLSDNKSYKVRIKAYKLVDGEKEYIGKGLVYHAVGKKNETFTNAKAVEVSQKTVTIKKGETGQIKATIVKQSKKKELLDSSHGPSLRYFSMDTDVVTVTPEGKIKAKEEGTCYVYVKALNGATAKVKVKVE